MRRVLVIAGLLYSVSFVASGQVRPTEILNPQLKADEQRYFLQLETLHQSIAANKFSFPFMLSRYANEKGGKLGTVDSNAIEFVYFEDRVVLKISGVYRAAFDASTLSENERASRAFEDVVVPILGLVRRDIPPQIHCNGIGFEITFHARDANKAYDYEGREVLTVVFDRDDAFAFSSTTEERQRQQLLNRADIFVNGRSFGLAPGQRDPLVVETLERSVPRSAREKAVPISAESAKSVAAASYLATASNPPRANGIASGLQSHFQSYFDAMVKEDKVRLHLDDKAPPSLEDYRDQTSVHLTVRNPRPITADKASIYKRAAQSFDLFLAPELKDILRELPAGTEYDVLHVTVVDQVERGSGATEQIDYIFPVEAVRSLTQNMITGQGLIDESVILVNGVRIALNLQLVE